MFTVGQRLYLVRTRKGITQSDLSRRSGIAQANLSKIEQGKQDPTVSTLLRICSALDIRPAEFFAEDSRKPPAALTRSAIEKIARGVLDPSLKLSPRLREIADLMRGLVPGLLKRRLSRKKIYLAWYELKSRLSREENQTIKERIDEEVSRQKEQAEREYERLRSALAGVLGRNRKL